MPRPRTAYKRILSGCTRGCSLNAENLPAGIGDLIHTWFERGDSNGVIIAGAKTLGIKLSNGAIGRHRASHLHAAAAVPEKKAGEQGPKLGDLEVIEAIIERGVEQVRLQSSKVSTEQLLQAIALKHKLTEGSVFDAMYEAMAGHEGDELDDLEGMSDEALRSADELAQKGTDNGSGESS